MPVRRLLTSEFVNSAQPPELGEQWIADTKQGGFGLRLWATKDGGQKAFALRVSDQNGKSIRATFRHQETLGYWFFVRRGEKLELGDYLEDARRWARDRTDQLKGRKTVAEEYRASWESANQRITTITFGKAARSVISSMRFRGLSQSYAERLDKLFF